MLTAISAIFVFLMVILVHEFGHFAVAKLVGIKVNEFSIGMGPKLLQTKKGETEYTVRILPIGGYVKMDGEDEKSNNPRSFNNANVFARIGVLLAGAVMNFILAIVILSIVSFGIGEPSTTIDEVTPNSPAQESGIIEGDTIISIQGEKTDTWDKIVDKIGNSKLDRELKIEISRDGSIITKSVIPIVEEGRNIIGIIPRNQKSASSAIKGGFEKTGTFLMLMFDFIGMIFKGKVGLSSLSGPVGIIREVGVAANTGIYNLLYLLGFISINLGFFNLLPIPALDGSRITFLLLELVRGKPMDPEKEGFVHFVGFILLISLMLIVTYRDIINTNLFKR